MTDPQRAGLPAPLLALAACCRAAFDPDAPAPVSLPDPETLLAWSRRHRVTGLAAKGLSRLGLGAPHAALQAEARAIAEANLRMADQALQCRDAFADAGIAVAFVKGLAVAARAYGEIATKTNADLDLLVAARDLEGAGNVLERLGYACALPRRSPLLRWHKRHKESIWGRESAAAVELHHRLADDAGLLAAIDPADAVPAEIVAGETLPTIGDGHLVPYLAVHGASSAWFRLKWLVDYAAIRRLNLPVFPHPGTERAVRVADRLADRLLGTRWSAGGLDRVDRWMVEAGLRQLAAMTPPTERQFGTVAIHLSQAMLGSGPGFALRDGVRQLRAMGLRD